MEDKHRAILRRYWSELRKDLEPIKLLPRLVRVLDPTDEQDIKAKDTREEKIDKLLELLPRRGPKAFDVFVRALQDVQPHLARPLLQDSENEEMKQELSLERTRSAHLREELQLIRKRCERERKTHEKTARELEELKSIHQALVRELENANKEKEETLLAEKNEKELLAEELNRLRDMCDQMYEDAQQKENEFKKLEENFKKTSEEKEKLIQKLLEFTDLNHNKMIGNGTDTGDEETSKTTLMKDQLHDTNPTFISQLMNYSGLEKTTESSDRTESVLETSRKQCQLVKMTKERDALKRKCEELEGQLEGTLASLERQRANSFHDRATSPEQPEHFDFEAQRCLQCEALEDECKVLRTEKDFIKGKKEKFEDEIKQLKNKINEIKEDFYLEKRTLQKEIENTKGLLERLSQDFEQEVNRARCSVTEGQLQELKALQQENEGMKQQTQKIKTELHKISVELMKEKTKAETSQEELDKGKKKLKLEKKKLQEWKDKCERAEKCRKEFSKELDESKRNLQLLKEQRCDETARLGEGLKAEREKCEVLKEEIGRWRNISGRVFNYTKDFDRHGVIYALGTNFGTTPWVNPSIVSSNLNRIIVTRSSDDQGQATDLLEYRKASLTCTKDEDRSWWCVDLSEKYALFLTHYTLRHGRDNGMSIIRNWRLEGSLDGRSWRLLRKHENDRGLKDPYPYYTATWSVDGEVGAFRYFRILQTGKNSSGRFAVYLSGIEFYGILLEMSHS